MAVRTSGQKGACIKGRPLCCDVVSITVGTSSPVCGEADFKGSQPCVAGGLGSPSPVCEAYCRLLVPGLSES